MADAGRKERQTDLKTPMLCAGKELVRHLITRTGLSGLHLRVRKTLGQNVDHLFAESLEERFSVIYRNRVWLNGRQSGSLSGLGSEIENTKSVRQRLPDLLQSIGTQTVLDIGCGDFNWMKEVEITCQYVGVDIVREMIEANRSSYGSQTRSFRTLDATCDPLPEADTILCREVLFHFSFRDIWSVVANFRKSGALFLVATNDSGLTMNADIRSGDFRTLNLLKPPFSFPSPFLWIPDSSVLPNRVLAVWRISTLPQRRN
jgi:SAM-dependent methyltransferase